ncbi:MAG TPA: hypothetical protein VK672_07920 [Solirubrobacteraceae bacterium]|jgi:hypothetical protein|nr:hypothetical protein [Solirubrobacteraceae bacterium]
MRHIFGATATRLLVVACAVGLTAAATALIASASQAGSPSVAKAARTVSLAETGHLTFDPSLERGAAIGERGQAVGTYNAPLELYLTVHAHYVTAETTIYPHGGSITGAARADYTITGLVGSFHGTMKITHGTGTYRHISGKLAIRGAINHRSLKLWVVTEGKATY